MKHKNDAGFSLVEVLVAIVILGLITIPMTSGMVFALKTMARTEEMMQAQLAVSSAVEELMASGIDAPINKTDENGVTTVAILETDKPYYKVTVSCDTVEVITYVRANDAEAGGDGT